MTIVDLLGIPSGSIFDQGVIPNSPEGIYMTDSNIGRNLLWVAKKGYADDWCIYTHWEDNGIGFVLIQGDKVSSKQNIQKLVPWFGN